MVTLPIYWSRVPAGAIPIGDYIIGIANGTLMQKNDKIYARENTRYYDRGYFHTVTFEAQ